MKFNRLISSLSGLLVAAFGFLPIATYGQCFPDETPPIIDCLVDSTVAANDPGGFLTSFSVVAADECDNSPTVTCNPPAPAENESILFPFGTTLVICTATDISGNTTNCSFAVTVTGPRTDKIAVRDQLIAMRASATNEFSKFDSAINYLNKSIDAARWLDDARPKKGKPGEEVFNNEKSAVSQLLQLRAKYPNVQSLIDSLVNIDRFIAEIAINDAMERNGSTSKINAAVNYLNKGNADAAANKPTNAIDDYKNAWKNAVGA